MRLFPPLNILGVSSHQKNSTAPRASATPKIAANSLFIGQRHKTAGLGESIVILFNEQSILIFILIDSAYSINKRDSSSRWTRESFYSMNKTESSSLVDEAGVFH